MFNKDFFVNISLLFDKKLLVPNKISTGIITLLDDIPQGIKGVIFDLDQTIVPYGQINISIPILATLDLYKNKYKCCILTNYPKSDIKANRINEIEFRTNISIIKAKKMKPDASAFYEAVEFLSLEISEVMIIGDRILTDIIGGNNVGLFTVLVPPLAPSLDPFFSVTIPRFIEKFLMLITRRLNK